MNLRDDAQQFISKGWRVMTTHELLAKRLDLPCSCSPGTVHVPCEGKLTERTAYYTKEFAKRVCHSILKGMSTDPIHREIHQGKNPQGNFGFGTECMCHEGLHHDAHITCGHCTQHDWESKLGLLPTKTPEVVSMRVYRLRKSNVSCTYFMRQQVMVPSKIWSGC